MAQTKQYDFFLSHSTQDHVAADQIYRMLIDRGFTCFYSPKSIPPGASWVEHIANALGSCKVFIFLASKNAYESADVRNEIITVTHIHDGRRPVICPYRIDREDIPMDIYYQLSSVNWIEKSNMSPAEFVDLLPKDLPHSGPDNEPPGDGPSPPPKIRYSRFARITFQIAILISLLLAAICLYFWGIPRPRLEHDFYYHTMIGFGLIGLGTSLVFHLRWIWPSLLLLAGCVWNIRTILLYNVTIGRTLMGGKTNTEIARNDMALLLLFMLGVALLVAAIANSSKVLGRKPRPYSLPWTWRLFRSLTGRSRKKRS